MEKLFVPYTAEKPLYVEINGHKVLILSPDAGAFDGAVTAHMIDAIRPLDPPESKKDLEVMLNDMARRCRASVVVAPPSVSMTEIVRSLESQLPWLH